MRFCSNAWSSCRTLLKGQGLGSCSAQGLSEHVQAHACMQARAVVDGLPGDIVALALPLDIMKIAESGLIDADWQARSALSGPWLSCVQGPPCMFRAPPHETFGRNLVMQNLIIRSALRNPSPTFC